MTIEIKVPPLPESVSDATLIAWHKAAGESVSRDENLIDLETDKVVLEVPAPVSGIITKIINFLFNYLLLLEWIIFMVNFIFLIYTPRTIMIKLNFDFTLWSLKFLIISKTNTYRYNN